MTDTPTTAAPAPSEWVPTAADGKRLHDYYFGKLKDIVEHPENYPLDALSQVMDTIVALNDLMDGNFEDDGGGDEDGPDDR